MDVPASETRSSPGVEDVTTDSLAPMKALLSVFTREEIIDVLARAMADDENLMNRIKVVCFYFFILFQYSQSVRTSILVA